MKPLPHVYEVGLSAGLSRWRPVFCGAGLPPSSAFALILSANADRGYVETWLKEHGLAVVPIQQGFNVLGQNGILRSLFSQEGRADPVPSLDLQPHIATILVAERKYIHAC